MYSFPLRYGLRRTVSGTASLAVLFISNVLHPVDHLTIGRLLDSDVRHGRGRCRPVPVLLARREPDDISRMHLLDRPPLTLDPAAAGRDEERLAQRVGMPGRPGPRLEGDAPRTRPRRGV